MGTRDDSSTIRCAGYQHPFNLSGKQPSAVLLNERTAYVANSRAIHDMHIYTNSKEDLPYALDRRNDKEIALDAMKTMEERREVIEQIRGREIEQTREQSYDRGYSW